jgi:hypothetical protein
MKSPLRYFKINSRIHTNYVDYEYPKIGEPFTPLMQTRRILNGGAFNGIVYCLDCSKVHEADDSINLITLYRGWTYKEPFFCLCCGLQICLPKFALSQHCNYCDTGQCHIDFKQAGLAAK